MAKNGYTRLKARYEELQDKHADLIAKHDAMQKDNKLLMTELENARQECGTMYQEREAYMRKVTYLQEEVERLNRARENTRHTIENLMDREAWLLRHTLGFIRFWYVKHFGL